MSDRKFFTPFFTYTGAFLFSIVLIVLVHEMGHYLAFLWRGYELISIRINPLMGSTSCPHEVQLEDAVFIALGGTIFNLSSASIFAIILRASKSPYWMPLKMFAATAFLIEGMVIIAGLFFQETVTDFAWLINLGWAPIFVGFLGVIFLIVGGLMTYKVWVLLGIDLKRSRRLIFLLNGTFILYVFSGYLICQMLLSSEMDFIKKFLALAMVLHLLYLGVRILLTPLILPRIQERMTGDFPKITKRCSRFSMILGSASWVLSFLILN